MFSNVTFRIAPAINRLSLSSLGLILLVVLLLGMSLWDMLSDQPPVASCPVQEQQVTIPDTSIPD